MELGRFNTDGTDLDDELGGRAWKELLRSQITATFGVNFVVPTHVAPTINSLSANSTIQGSPAFTLTVYGNDFKNGATVKFGNIVMNTTFLSATSLSAAIPATEIASAGTRAVVVTNPDNQVSINQNFNVQTVSLSGVSIASAFYDNGGGTINTPPTRPKMTFITLDLTRPQTAGTTILLEQKNADGSWSNAFTNGLPVSDASLGGTGSVQQVVGRPGKINTGTLLRVRVSNGTQSSAYSANFTMP